ncbi:MAG: hypothetical protein OWU33_00395 [Firmicutes bacterium]|nr:hypothetical protein [Bacillota bacterium]
MMITLISARKSFEFPVDGLRLTAISTPDTLEAIRNLCHFTLVQIARPMETFGPVPKVFPPGVVFNSGYWAEAEGRSVFIRFLHVEQTRIVIDVAGPSDALNGLSQAIFNVIRRTARVFDDGPVLTDPIAELDYSEMTIQLPGPLTLILPAPLRELFLNFSANEGNHTLLSSLFISQHLSNVPYEGDRLSSPIISQGYRLSLRKGTVPEQYVYFSGAPLNTEAHRDYLTKLHGIVTQLLNL